MGRQSRSQNILNWRLVQHFHIRFLYLDLSSCIHEISNECEIRPGFVDRANITIYCIFCDDAAITDRDHLSRRFQKVLISFLHNGCGNAMGRLIFANL